jgi:ribokinase
MNPIVVMPDFFIDRIIKLRSKEDFMDALNQKAKFGGGSIRNMPTVDIKGGNAVNIAYCLAQLGAKVNLFTISDKIGTAVLTHIFSKFGEKVNLRIADGKHGLTTSFEFINEQGLKANVMLSDTGDNINFGPERINSEDDLRILRNADAVAVVNWASNSSGTRLTEYVFKSSPKSLHFIDPADIETRRQEFLDSLTKIGNIIDILSINENECNSLAKAVGFDPLIPSYNYDSVDVKNAAAKLAEKVGVSIDLHTRIGAAWSNGKETSFANAIKVEAKTLTGAGDSWDAADILGHLAGLDTKERLLFSNAYVSLYIRNALAEPADFKGVLDLLERIDM